jgi:hypothetical protein
VSKTPNIVIIMTDQHRAEDPLPLPGVRYAYKSDPHNWWSPYR